ncbi:circadian clock-controlled protein daywake [Anabrus simplex]|uniref:circadian clock-controlled protein daywake n=1 Tax=Anabrus simplex TaxID=316456 RepID=UPI0035A2A711
MLRFSSVICFLAALAVCYGVTTKSIVQEISSCHRNRPDFETCLRGKLEALLPEIGKTGVPEVGIESTDPFEIPELLVQYRNGNWSADLKITNSKTWVSDETKITDLRADINDPKRFKMGVNFFMPTLYTEGNYKVDARLLIPIRTKGYYNITMSDIKATAEISGDHFEKDGVDYVKIKDFNMMPDVGDMKVYVSNLFPGNDELSQAALDFGNRYWRLIYKELLPFTNDQWAGQAIDTLNKVFTEVPFNELFPEA